MFISSATHIIPKKGYQHMSLNLLYAKRKKLHEKPDTSKFFSSPFITQQRYLRLLCTPNCGTWLFHLQLYCLCFLLLLWSVFLPLAVPFSNLSFLSVGVTHMPDRQTDRHTKYKIMCLYSACHTIFGPFYTDRT